MALTPNFVEQHITEWERALTSPFYAHRKHWPSYLFHHTALENAVVILGDGCLRSRNDARNQLIRDVAAPGVIDTRTDAHDFVRLYFRPKTPTQWHIEGIRKAEDCAFNATAHAPILVMFLVDSRAVLLKPDIMFSDKNMQLNDTRTGNDEAFFSNIDFLKVYSEGSTGGDRSYTEKRCAEVLSPSPLNLEGILKGIFLRSEAEKETLLFMLGNLRNIWEPYCQVSDALKVFQKEYAFFDELKITHEGVIFRINPRKDCKNISIKIDIWDNNDRLILQFQNDNHAATPNHPYKEWIHRHALPDGKYLVEAKLEGHLAYRNVLLLENTLF